MRATPGYLAACCLALLGFPAYCAADVPLTPYTIDSAFDGPGSLYAADVDGDGNTDVLGAAVDGNQIAWWRNDGSSPSGWTKYLIGAAFGGAISVYATDLDGDGDTDVLGAAWNQHEMAWWRNDGGDPPTWVKQTIVSGFTNAHEVYACDVDLDGDLDVLGAGAGNNVIAWWRNDGGSPTAWTQQTLSASFGGARSVSAGDLDGDGDIDIVGAALRLNQIAWWRNDGGSPLQWTKLVVASTFRGAHMVRPCDIDGDRDLDLVAAGYSADELAWWRNDGGDPIVWTKFTIAMGFDGAVTACPADLDADGDADILGAAQDASDIAWWSNDGGDPVVWTMHSIDVDFAGVWPAHAADLDGDRFIDILAGGYTADEVRWWRNELVQSGVNGGGAFASSPGLFRLHQNAPNPFGAATTIHFDLTRAGGVRLEIYDVAGRLVRTLVEGSAPAGGHAAGWDGKDENGRVMPSGVYFYRMAVGALTETRRMALLR